MSLSALQLSSEFDALASAVLVFLFIVFAYLVLTRLFPKNARHYAHKRSEESEHLSRHHRSKLEQIRAATHSEMRELEDKVAHLKQVKMEIRKKYMMGGIDSQMFHQLDKENEHKLIDAEVRLHALKQVAKSST